MKNFYNSRAWWLSLVIGSFLGAGPATGVAKSVLYAINDVDPYWLYVVDPVTGAEQASVPISLSGQTIGPATGLAVNPLTNEMYAAVKISGQNGSGRNLIRIDPTSGQATNIGNMGQPIASLAFTSDGVLYAVSGDCANGCGGSATPETLFTVNTANATLTFFQTLGNGEDGEAIGFNPVDGLMYHMSGWGANLIFEKINLSTHAVTPVPMSGDSVTDLETMGFTYDAAQGLFVGSLIECFCDPTTLRFYVSLTADGVLTHVSTLEHWWKDFAFYEVPDLDLEPLSDVDGNGAVDVAVLVSQPGVNDAPIFDPGVHVFVKDGATGDPISQMTVFDETWRGIDLAATPDGADTLIGVLGQKDDDSISVALHRADNGTFVREIGFFSRKWVPSGLVYVPDADAPGGSAFAVVAKNEDDNRVAVQLRHSSDGSLINTTTYFRNNWEAIDLETMDDLSGNGRPEIILLGQSDLGQIVVFVKDAATKEVVNKISYLGKTTTPKAISVISDIGGSAAPELAVLGERPDGRNIVQNRDAETDERVDNVFFLNGRWNSIDVGGLADVNGNSSSDLAVLAQHESARTIRSEVRDASTGDLIQTVTFLGSSWDARAMGVFEDIGGNGIQELGVLARRDDGAVRVQIRDASSAATVTTISIP